MKKHPNDSGPEPRYRWRETWPGEGHEDAAAFDGPRQFGRIMLETNGTMRMQWRWSISNIDGVKRHILPHNGWLAHPRVAAAQVEDLYERLMELKGLALNSRRS
ncbi:hypothetical protein HFN83_03680 [Rhizobium laguerreae]|nr:hypothetical protein [Rhizobium laguerreae]